MSGNTKQKDNAGRVIFENANLCSQFLKEYSGMEIFKEVEPKDIEDMTERFLPMFSEERQSDVVKKVKLRDKGELYVVALIEHKSSVDYNVVMQMFHYMSYIWEEYERSMEGNMARFFENFEKFDIQEHARVNREKGEDIHLINLVYKKLQKGKSSEVIADEVEEQIDTVESIIDAIESVSTDPFDADKVYEEWKTHAMAV